VETQQIDAVGLRCPRPIVELAKASRASGPGALIVIRADDLAFESDVRAWCEATGRTLVEIRREGRVICATVRIPGGQEGT
jgi:TusA-related sulfurtransferase